MNNTLINNTQSKEEIKIRKYFKLNKNKNATY